MPLAFVLAAPDSPAREQALPASAVQAAPLTDEDPWPATSLLDTGLHIDGSAEQIHPDNLAFTPQYPLWSDGADKRRWLNLPAGSWIDAARPDAWEFPPGSRLWKEFSHAGKRIETRLIQRRADKSWLYASYIWNEAQTDAVLAPAEGVVLSDAAVSGSYTANITPDPDTGLGQWTLCDFVDTFRTGRRMGRGRKVLPPMPTSAYKNFSDEDLAAIYLYLQSIPAVRNRVPEPVAPAG